MSPLCSTRLPSYFIPGACYLGLSVSRQTFQQVTYTRRIISFNTRSVDTTLGYINRMLLFLHHLIYVDRSTCAKQLPVWSLHRQNTGVLAQGISPIGKGYGCVSHLLTFQQQFCSTGVLQCYRILLSVMQHGPGGRLLPASRCLGLCSGHSYEVLDGQDVISSCISCCLPRKMSSERRGEVLIRNKGDNACQVW